MTAIRDRLPHEAVQRLLPWFVNGTLDGNERAEVEAHVANCGECRDDIALLREVQDVVKSDTTIPLVARPRAQQLLEDIDAARPRRRQWLATAVAAAAAALMLVALRGDDVPEPDSPLVYETATSTPVPGSVDYVIELTFAAGTDARARDKVLGEIAISHAPVAGSATVYRVVLQSQADTLAELGIVVGAIESRPEVAAARVVAVQLPVE